MNEEKNTIGWLLYDMISKRILLHRRDHEAKESPDCWDCFGGKVENGETAYEGFLRELCEELGITVDKNKVTELALANAGTLYFIPFSMKDTCKLRLGEGAGFAWLSIDYALRLDDITDYAKKIIVIFQASKSKF
ncbi:MAG: NUDIX domain-containing protein [Patescibacteria group bacterium]